MEEKLPSELAVPLHGPLAWHTQIFEPSDFLVLPGPPVVVGELPGQTTRKLTNILCQLEK